MNVTKLPNGRVRSPNFNAGRGDTDLARWGNFDIRYVLTCLVFIAVQYLNA